MRILSKLNYVNREPRSTGSEGFTLIEVAVFVFLVGTLSVVLLLNLRGAQTSASVLERSSQGIISELRRAQVMTISGLNFQGNSVCGYGIHYLNESSYLIYAGGEAICSTADRNYQGAGDFNVQTVKILDSNVKFKASFDDIFFEPPDPKIFFDNSFSLSSPPLPISLGFENQICPSGCKTINVFPSGKIDLN